MQGTGRCSVRKQKSSAATSLSAGGGCQSLPRGGCPEAQGHLGPGRGGVGGPRPTSRVLETTDICCSRSGGQKPQTRGGGAVPPAGSSLPASARVRLCRDAAVAASTGTWSSPLLRLWSSGDVFPRACPLVLCLFSPHPGVCLMILEREEGGWRERNIDVRGTSSGGLPYTPRPGIEPAPFGEQDALQSTGQPGQGSQLLTMSPVPLD